MQGATGVADIVPLNRFGRGLSARDDHGFAFVGDPTVVMSWEQGQRVTVSAMLEGIPYYHPVDVVMGVCYVRDDGNLARLDRLHRIDSTSSISNGALAPSVSATGVPVDVPHGALLEVGVCLRGETDGIWEPEPPMGWVMITND